MPYNTPMNRAISQRIRDIDQRHIDRIRNISETNGYDIATPLEAMTMRHRDVVGGSGFAAATLQDLGYESTMGASPSTGGGMSGGGMSGGGMSGGGMSGGGMSGGGMSGGGMSGGGMSGGGMSGGALLTLTDMYKMTGQPPPMMQAKITQKASPHKNQPIPEPARGPIINGPVGGAMPRRSRAPSSRNEMVRRIMTERSMTLPEASKYIKMHNLYKRA